MNKTTKEMISEYITDKTNKFDLVHTDMFTTVSIADALHISRSITSQYLNELCEEDEIYNKKFKRYRKYTTCYSCVELKIQG